MSNKTVWITRLEVDADLSKIKIVLSDGSHLGGATKISLQDIEPHSIPMLNLKMMMHDPDSEKVKK